MDNLERWTFSELRRWEKRQHRPNQMLILALLLGVVAGAMAVGASRMWDDYWTTQHEIQTGSLLP